MAIRFTPATVRTAELNMLFSTQLQLFDILQPFCSSHDHDRGQLVVETTLSLLGAIHGDNNGYS